ncbi:MAG: helix-turn-helix transcriptional regulator [SAR202 cluster bacterium]|nr:helix-turn-helix transcriptional regulator [SAR202 cluster bacterium]
MRHAVLALLSKGPAHGYDLKQQIDALLANAADRVNIGQIYTTLKRLERDGLVARQEVEQSGRPNKSVYELTGAGTAELKGWLESADGAPRLRAELYLKVLLAASNGFGESSKLIDRQRRAHLQVLRDLHRLATNRGDGSSKLNRLLIEGAALQLEAELKWLDLCEQELTEVRR